MNISKAELVELVALLRREGAHSGVWFADELLQAADFIEQSISPPDHGVRENPCAKIFDHKWLDPECVETGCQSLALIERHAKLAEELAPPADPHTDPWLLGFCRARKMIAGAIRRERAALNKDTGS